MISKRKKVLIITYYWPPAGGIGVHRCLKFVKYLRDFNWEPIVYAPENAQYAYYDVTNEMHIPQEITVLKYPIIEPFNLFKKLSGRSKNDESNPVYARSKKVKFIDNLAIWIRGNFFIPDARCLWIRPSLRFLSRYIKENKIDAILTDGPPHTNTVIGCKLSKKFNIPWLADFQDPWTQVDYYKMFKISGWADKRHKKMEQEVFKTAKKITVASPSWAKDLEAIGAYNVDPVFWGYDEEDFTSVEKSKHNKFSVVHAGLLGYDRNPEVFLHVLSDIVSENEEFKSKLQINLAGSVDFTVQEEIRKYNLENHTVYLGNVPRPDAIKLTVDASLLLLPLNKADNVKGRIPGKLFECMRSENPILCLGPNGTDVQEILIKTGCGISVDYTDYEGIKNFVMECFMNQSSSGSINRNRYVTYDVKNQVSKIATFLNQITD